MAFGKENAWVRGILRELGIFKLNKPTLVLEDNTAAIALSGQGPTKRSRHYDISFFLFKEQVAMREMKVEDVTLTKIQLIFSPSLWQGQSSSIFGT